MQISLKGLYQVTLKRFRVDYTHIDENMIPLAD